MACNLAVVSLGLLLAVMFCQSAHIYDRSKKDVEEDKWAKFQEQPSKYQIDMSDFDLSATNVTKELLSKLEKIQENGSGPVCTCYKRDCGCFVELEFAEIRSAGVNVSYNPDTETITVAFSLNGKMIKNITGAINALTGIDLPALCIGLEGTPIDFCIGISDISFDGGVFHFCLEIKVPFFSFNVFCLNVPIASKQKLTN